MRIIVIGGDVGIFASIVNALGGKHIIVAGDENLKNEITEFKQRYASAKDIVLSCREPLDIDINSLMSETEHFTPPVKKQLKTLQDRHGQASTNLKRFNTGKGGRFNKHR